MVGTLTAANRGVKEFISTGNTTGTYTTDRSIDFEASWRTPGAVRLSRATGDTILVPAKDWQVDDAD